MDLPETSEVKKILQMWNLSEGAIKVIIDKGYNSLDLLKSLVPSVDNFTLLNFSNMPDRTMYAMKWKQWLHECKQAEKLTNPLTTSPDNQIDLLRQYSSSDSEIDACTRPAQSHPETSELALCQKPSDLPLPESALANCNPLRNLLEKSSSTRQLLKIGRQLEFRRSEQSELCDIILDHLLKDRSDQKPKLAYGVFIKWAKHVHDLFTRESEAIWFSITPPLKQGLTQLSPGAKAPPSASARPHGKLYDRYNKRQAIWRESRGLVKKTIGSKRASSNATVVNDVLDEIDTVRRRKKEELPLGDGEINKGHIEDELKTNGDIITISKYQGLESSSILETAWKATWSLRKQYLLFVPTAQYLKKFPALCLMSVGPQLMNIDFTALNPKTSSSALYTGLRKNSEFIENRAYSKLRSLSKPLRAQQQRIHDLPKDTELQKLTAVLLLLPFAIVGGKTGVRTKASRFDAAIRFIFVAKTRSEGEAYLQELGKEASRKSASSGVGVQPLVIAIGEDLANINSAFVVVDGIWFCCPNILEAVDLCFKTFYVFNLRYPLECEHIWQILQFTCYDIRDANHDKYIIDVNSFLNEIQDTCSSSQETRENAPETSSLETEEFPLELTDLETENNHKKFQNAHLLLL